MEYLLDRGAEVNAIGHDDAVVASIKRSFAGCEDNQEQRIRDRGTGFFEFPPKGAEMLRIRDLLGRHGGISLCLFPVKGLPGYAEMDIQAMSVHKSRTVLPSTDPQSGVGRINGV